MLTLLLDEIANEPKELPAPVIASISAGMPISDQQRKDLTMSDVEKSLTPAPTNTPIFERGGYLNPEPSASWVSVPKNEKGQSKVLDSDTVWYLTRMYKAAQNFTKLKKHIVDLKNNKKHPSDNDLKRTKGELRTQSLRYANLASISATRLNERSSTLDPKLLQEVQRDTKALNEKMDTQFKQSIKAGDLELPRQEVGRLGLYMDKTSNELKELDKNSPAATNANTASTTPSL